MDMLALISGLTVTASYRRLLMIMVDPAWLWTDGRDASRREGAALMSKFSIVENAEFFRNVFEVRPIASPAWYAAHGCMASQLVRCRSADATRG